MVQKSLGQLEEHAYYILFMAFILIVFWHAIWGVTDTIKDYLEKHYNIKPIQFHIGTIGLVILIIGLHPEILDKF
jgi:succinate dehydrogenase hydrophobic anchor subunit